MRKGISPVIAVVLLVAIAATSAMMIYFWMPGLASSSLYAEQATADPVSAQSVECMPGAGGWMAMDLLNLGTAAIDANFTINHNSGQVELTGVAILPGRAAAVNFTNTNLTDGSIYVIVGTGKVTPVYVVC